MRGRVEANAAQRNLVVMAGLVPAIHVGRHMRKRVDARVKPGHDGGEQGALRLLLGSPNRFLTKR